MDLLLLTADPHPEGVLPSLSLLAHNVRTAPTEVYTVGFQNGDAMASANRFTGSAVKFLSVAKFAK